MKTKTPVLTKEERDVLILAAAHPLGNKLSYLSYSEIAERLGLSVSRVKRLMHNSLRKLKVNNRIDAVRYVKRYGEISLKEFYSLDELVELYSSLGPDKLRRIAYLIRQGPKYRHLTKNDKQIIHTGRRQDSILTNRERDVLICVGLGLTNKEIADRLYISTSSVATFISRACRKLEENNRTSAFMSAMKQREILMGDILSINELLYILTPLGPEYIEEMARLMDKKLEQESNLTGS